MTQELTYEPIDEALPVEWEPPPKLVNLAHELHQRLLSLGHDAKQKKEELKNIWRQQGEILRQFYDDENLCRATGCEGGWYEYISQEDVREALGLEDASQTKLSQTAGLFTILPYTDENLLESGLVSKVQQALGYLQEQRRQIEAANTPKERHEAISTLNETIEELKALPHRQIQREYQSHRPAPCTVVMVEDKMHLYDGENHFILNGKNLPATMRVASCLSGGRWLSFSWNKEGIYWTDKSTGEYGMVMRWPRRMDDDEIRRIVAHIPYIQQRL